MAATAFAIYILLLLRTAVIPTSAQQQVGSFFTAIYLNGAPISPGQVSCSGMGQPGYCCGSGYSCAWDNGGKVACCASGNTCQGGASGGSAGAGQGQYYTSSPYYPPQQTTTIYQQQSEDCHCQSQTYGNVVPIVPVTVATLSTSYTPSTTTTYVAPTTTLYQSTTTTALLAAGAVQQTTSDTSCPRGYTTLTEANVGIPTRTVGCQVIINGAVRMGRGGLYKRILAPAISVLVILLPWP